MPPRHAALVVHRLRPTSGGVEIDVDDGAGYPRLVPFQYNPETLKKTIRSSTGEANEGTGRDVLRRAGPPEVTIELTAELLAWDPNLPAPRAESAKRYGVAHQIAVLEELLYPASEEVERQRDLALQGKIEVVPEQSRMILLAWSSKRITPVALTALTITEDRFDEELRPVHAKADLSLRILSVNDLGFGHPGSRIAMRYHKDLEETAEEGAYGSLSRLGFTLGDIGLE